MTAVKHKATRYPAFMLVVAAAFCASSCINIFRTVEVVELPVAGWTKTTVASPVKVHLLDGRTAIFRNGASFGPDSITGIGNLYGVASTYDATRIRAIAVDSVAAVEAFESRVDEGKTVLVSALATAAAAVVTPPLWAAIFGSCPTAYSYGPDGPVLEAELFPNSIAPLFEMRDVDLLSAQPDSNRHLRLAIRNEALETHYINQIQLIETRHGKSDLVFPDRDGHPVALRDLTAVSNAIDRSGRDVASVLSAADGMVYETSAATIASADSSSLWDSITFSVPRSSLGKSDTAYVYIRARNSLLGTVYFYEKMLAEQGPNAVKWLGDDLDEVSHVVGLADFYRQQMGLRVEVENGLKFEEVGRVREVGPIAFDHVAVPVPVLHSAGDSVHLRLRFVADAWRIDQLAVGLRAEQSSLRYVSPSTVDLGRDAPPARSVQLLDVVHAADDEYAVTHPGDAFDIIFDLNGSDVRATPDSSSTYLLAMQGYYVEWIRGDWLRANRQASRFEPTKASVVDAINRWSIVKDEFEEAFFNTKIPTARQGTVQ